MLAHSGGGALGRDPGAAWNRGRYDGPYLRDALLDHGVLAETLETATTWTGLHALHDAVAAALRGALEARGTAPVVLCHVSHLYSVGASLYFTVIARQEQGDEVAQWQAAKAAACEAIVPQGGTITHHHAIGRDHAPTWRRRSARYGHRAAAGRQGRARPGRHPEPREAAA